MSRYNRFESSASDASASIEDLFSTQEKEKSPSDSHSNPNRGEGQLVDINLFGKVDDELKDERRSKRKKMKRNKKEKRRSKRKDSSDGAKIKNTMGPGQDKRNESRSVSPNSTSRNSEGIFNAETMTRQKTASGYDRMLAKVPKSRHSTSESNNDDEVIKVYYLLK